MDSLSLVERVCAYTSATGMPPTGVHRKLTDQVLKYVGVRCIACNGTGLQLREGRRRFCADCHGFLLRLSAHEVARLYQIVTARFPELSSRAPLVQEAADRWYAGSPIPVTAPRYFGREPLPASVPLRPDGNAQLIASVTWRNGGRSEYVWTHIESDNLCVLWERLPDLLLDSGEPWTEVFSWAREAGVDPVLSARQLLHQGWSATNPAYEWLAAPFMAKFFGLTRHFSATGECMVRDAMLMPLFHAAIKLRLREAKQASASAAHKRSANKQTTNIGPYAFGTKPASPRKPTPPTPLLRYALGAVPTEPVVEARILPFRRNIKQLSREPDDGVT